MHQEITIQVEKIIEKPKPFAFCAPEGFDPASQPVNIIDIFNKYSKLDKKYIFTLRDTLDKFSLTQGTTARHGYEIAGVKYVDDYNVVGTTIVGTLSAGNYTEIPVVSTAGFKDSGIIRVFWDASWGGGLESYYEFVYTSKTSTSFIGTNQNMPVSFGSDTPSAFCNGKNVVPVIPVGGTNNWVLISGVLPGYNGNSHTEATMVDIFGNSSGNTIAAGQCYEWLYCGKTIEYVDFGGASLGYGSVKYIHFESDTQLKGYGYCNNYGVPLTGILNIPKSLTRVGGIGVDINNPGPGWVGLQGAYLTRVIIPDTIISINSEFNYYNTLTRFDCYPLAAPTTYHLTMCGNPAPLHIKPNATGYDVAPWTDTAIFSEIIEDLTDAVTDDLSFPYDFPIELDFHKKENTDKYLAIVDEYLDLDDNVKIVRDYTSPWFSDPTKLTNGGTKSCKFPQTERNKAIAKNMHRADMNTNFPYRIQSSNNYVNGVEIWRNAEVKVLSDFEYQFTYGINRAKYVPLFTKKLNEIVTNGTTILESDWVVNWNKVDMFATGKKYKYLDYISVDAASDALIFTDETGRSIIQPAILPNEPILSNQKDMTMHPFVLFSNILDLISTDQNINEFTKLKDRLTNKGLILGNKIGNKIVTFTQSYSTQSVTSKNIPVGNLIDPMNVFVTLGAISNNSSAVYDWVTMTYNRYSFGDEGYVDLWDADDVLIGTYLNDGVAYRFDPDSGNFQKYTEITPVDERGYNTFHINSMPIGISFPVTLNINLNLTISSAMPQLRLLGYKTFNSTTPDLSIDIPYILSGTDKVYNTTFSFEVTSEQQSWFFAIGDTTSRSYIINGTIVFTYSLLNAIYGIPYSEFNVSIPAHGYYDCLLNLPQMTQIEFIQQMCIMTGLSIGYDSDGNFKFYSLDDVKENMLAGNFYDWTNRISEVTKSLFQFNSNAKNNWIKYSNSDSIVSYVNKEKLTVDDDTIATERDLFVLKFDVAEKSTSGKSEFILYKQTVKETATGKTFDNAYSGKPDVAVADRGGVAFNEPILPNDYSDGITAPLTGIWTANLIYIDPKYLYKFHVGGTVIFRYDDNPLHIQIRTIEDIYSNYIVISGAASGAGESISFNNVTASLSSTGFVTSYYSIHQKLINQPKVKDVHINLEFFESANIKPDYPIWIGEWGVWALYLGHTAPDRDVSLVTLLIINEQL